MTALEQFIGAYLHQDYDIEGDEWGALRKYIADEGTSQATVLAGDVDSLLEKNSHEAEIKTALLGMGIGFTPEVDGLTYGQWLLILKRRALEFV